MGFKGDTRSLDYSSYALTLHPLLRAKVPAQSPAGSKHPTKGAFVPKC